MRQPRFAWQIGLETQLAHRSTGRTRRRARQRCAVFSIVDGAAICRGRGERIERLPAYATAALCGRQATAGVEHRRRLPSARCASQSRRTASTRFTQRVGGSIRRWTLGRFTSLDAQSPASGRRFAHALGRPGERGFRATRFRGAPAFRQRFRLFRRLSPCTTCTASGRILQNAATGSCLRHSQLPVWVAR